MMIKRAFTVQVLLICAVALASCSFNHTTVAIQTTATPSQTKEIKKPEIAEHDSTTESDVCPVYVAPKLPRAPELPFEELSHISPGDDEALDDIQKKHIEELRLYIVRVNAILAKAQRDYAKRCADYIASRA